jgi:hypothetical protein
VHVIYPNIFVRKEQCLDMRESIMADLISTFGQRQVPFNSWSDVVDSAVYEKSGLRMLGSRKTEPCGKCKGKSKGKNITETRCLGCENRGSVDQGRPYAVLFVADGQGKRDLEKESLYAWYW